MTRTLLRNKHIWFSIKSSDLKCKIYDKFPCNWVIPWVKKVKLADYSLNKLSNNWCWKITGKDADLKTNATNIRIMWITPKGNFRWELKFIRQRNRYNTYEKIRTLPTLSLTINNMQCISASPNQSVRYTVANIFVNVS